MRRIIRQADRFGGLPVYEVNLGEWSTMGVGGTARAVFPQTASQLCAALAASGEKTPVGCGSNILFADGGYLGTVIFTERLDEIAVNGDFVRAYAGVRLGVLVEEYKKRGFGGVEYLVGIPASVGGAVVMNAGAFGKSIADSVIRVAVCTGTEVEILEKGECGFHYRGSGFAANTAVLYADFKYEPDEQAAERAAEYLKRRRANQPAGRSFGSTFKNPEGDAAGRLIDAAGLKGCKIGGARVSEKHANFIIGGDGVTAADVRKLMEYIKKRVSCLFGVTLEEEVRFIGEF